jgi:3'-phosphoadenosine 5'-phosphosulfate (PAPS) 3'-phosphatase
MNPMQNVANNTAEPIWQDLKNVISQSAGFQNWQSKQQESPREDLDKQISSYLKDTLQTLAY